MGEIASDSIYESFNETAGRFPDKIALVYLGSKYTYSRLKELAERFAASLYNLGVGEGDKAIIYLPNIPQWIIAWLGLLRIGAVAIPITPIYTPYDLKYIANNSEAETIICLDTNFGYVIQVLPETRLKRVIVSRMVELLPWWKKLIGKGFDKVPEGKFTLGENIFTFKKMLQKSPLTLPPLRARGEEIAEILYTGGTLGFPKGVPISHILFLESSEQQRKASEPLIRRGEDIVLQGGPLFHILGQVAGLGGPLCLSGDTLILLPRVNLDGMFDHIQRFKATTFFGVPTLYRMILEHDRVDMYDLSSLKYCFSGGDVLPLEVAERWLKKFSRPIYQGYGTTETCGGVSLSPAGEEIPLGSAGKIIPTKEVRVVDPDTLKLLPPNEPGELLVFSKHGVKGYWNNPKETAESFVNLDGKVWYRTRDIVRVDEEGWLYFLDRSVDTIKHKGYRVAASEVEAVLQEHPAVIASCVIGVPDEKVGERIKAFVVLKEDVRGVSGYELIKWCRERLAPYKVPSYIEFRDMLPKSKVGKLLRREMRSEERKKLEEGK